MIRRDRLNLVLLAIILLCFTHLASCAIGAAQAELSSTETEHIRPWFGPAPPAPVHAYQAPLEDEPVAGLSSVLEYSPPIVSAASLPTWAPPEVARWWDLMHELATNRGVAPELGLSIMTVESCGHSLAQSGAGALGLMQVVPRYHPAINRGAGPFDPRNNISVGLDFLAQSMRAEGHRDPSGAADWLPVVTAAAARYNGGGGGAARYDKAGGLPDMPCANIRDESIRHACWTAGLYDERQSDYSPTFSAWYGAGGGRLCAAARTEMERSDLVSLSQGATP